MIVKDLFAMCDKDKLMACIAEKYRDALAGVLEVEAVAARYLPVLEELETITPTSDGVHFVLGVHGNEGVEAMDFYAPAIKKQILQMAILEDLTEETICNSPELLDWAARPAAITCLAFTYTPWAEALGMEVYAENIQEVGAEEMAAQILLEMTEAGFAASAVETQRQNIEALLGKTKYASLEEYLLQVLPKPETEAERMAQKRKRVLFNHRNYHLLLKYADQWNP